MYKPKAHGESAGTSSLMGMLIATGIFTLSFGTILQQSIKEGDDADLSRQDDHAAVAATVADLLLLEPGTGWYMGGATCVDGIINVAAFTPEQVRRLGLGQERCALGGTLVGGVGRISFDKLENLYKAKSVADATNGAVDYEDAREGLGLTDRDFHLRSWPVLQSTLELLSQGRKDPNMKPLYIGDYSSAAAGVPPHTFGKIDSSEALTIYLNVTNNGASSTIFDGFFELDLKKDKMAFTLHTPVLAAGASGNMSFTVRKTSDWEWKNANKKEVAVEVHDKNTKLIDTVLDLSGVTMTYGSARQTQIAEAEKMSFVRSGGSVSGKYYFKSFNGKGELTNFADWTFRLENATGVVVRTDVLPNEDDSFIEHTFTASGSYRARLWNDALSTLWNQDYVNVVDAEPGPYGGGGSFSVGEAVAPEIGYIDAVIERFEANAFSATYGTASVPYLAGGDVYPDIKDAMNDDLPLALTDASGNPTLSKYTTLIVGSNVDHNAMTSGAAKNTIRDWVLAGGTLLVFGSSDQSVNWLQPIFHSSLDTASGGLATPDEKHASLTTPNALDYSSYRYSTEWNYNAGADTKFTHVVTSGATGDVLGVGNPGAFGDGKVILSSWRPYNLTSNQAETCAAPLTSATQCQAMFLIHNLVTLSYRELYLDYGPTIPEGAPVGVQMRVAIVYHPELENDVEIRLISYVFG